ncbi:MAG: SDR family NAD(P)-dependent oxidoreductase [Candidatus Electrothrix scaldis]|nr:MAG: SDR family NAD(P)-dependent oxidoreductase [Candidatus Electrothrix sp. GW3-3]
MNSSLIAIIGMACHYPGAQDLLTFWENILTRRRQFRPLPDSRLPASLYYDADPAALDKTYCRKAGLIDGLHFDPAKYRIPRSTFDSADIVHWLALKVALASLDDAGFKKESVPKEKTGVVLGNTLTGEYSRSEGLRLRWPFVRRVLEKTALEKGLSAEQSAELIRTAEAYYKSVFTPITEDTLAGALSNTIAGRICNYLDLHGGGYTVDGACSSSIIAAATAATHLVNGDLDLALAGGVDISLDTFELVGFAKTAALTNEDMRVYDRRAKGFIPGEGCGFVVMKRLEDAVADGDYVYAVLHGWGISSDGKGGLTAPNAQGQAKALQRAYERAAWDIHDLDFIEGHGTGTAVGDKTELEGIALAMNTMNTMKRDNDVGARRAVPPGESLRRCGMTSLKSLIGHTKAASGIGALIKTVIALNQRILPPLANCFDPNPVFAGKASALYPLLHGEICSPRSVLRAGVSGMGFGGINSHLALASGDPPAPKLIPAVREQKLLADYQYTELFIFSAPTVKDLLARVQAAEDLARNICEGERADLAAYFAALYGQEKSCGPVRAAVTAGTPEALLDALAEIGRILRTSPLQAQQMIVRPKSGVCIGNDVQEHRLGFLFPGQGSQRINMGYRLVQRYDWAEQLVRKMEKVLAWPEGQQLSDFIFYPLERAHGPAQIAGWRKQLKQTEIAQPALCLVSMLQLRQLERLGIRPDAVGGHSLGELTAFYAAGAYSSEELIRFAALRGQAMSPGLEQAGTMAGLACSATRAQALLDKGKGYAVVANKNSPSQTVISGEASCIEWVCRYAEEQGIQAIPLPVANAFHSRFVRQAAQVLAESRILPEYPPKITTALFSGLQGGRIDAECNLWQHFAEQVVSPVDFITLVQDMSKDCDLLLEVGPGKVLSGLARTIIAASNEEDVPSCFPLETEPEQDKDLHHFLARYFVQGGNVKWQALYEDRLIRPFTPVDERVFLTNPCERPFPEQEEGLASPLFSSGLLGGGKAERVLAKYAGIPQEKLASYLERRGRFLGGMIRVDLENMASLKGKPILEPYELPETSEASESLQKHIPSSSDQSLIEKPLAKDELRDTHPSQEKEESPVTLLINLIEERTGFPPESLSMDLRLLDDLNLDSIKAAELIAEAAHRAGVSAAQLNIAEYANATLQEVSDLLGKEDPYPDKQVVQGESSRYPGWVRDFTLQYLPEPLPAAQLDGQEILRQGEEVLILFEPAEQELAEQLQHALQPITSEVQLVSFPEARQSLASLLNRFAWVVALLPHQDKDEMLGQQGLLEHVTRLHTIVSSAFHSAASENPLLAVVQFADGFFGEGAEAVDSRRCSAKALAASLHLEQPDLRVRVLDFAPQVPVAQLCAFIMAELRTPGQYAAVGYAADQVRRVPRPVLRNITADQPRTIRWSPKDVVLATGGAKGITAECVLAFARSSGVQLALVGSSSPALRNEQHDEILHTLKRANEAGLFAHYYQCDVTDAEAVRRLVHQVEKEQGRITGVIHGSALNRPADLRSVSVEQALDEISPKVVGAMNLCEALQANPPRLFMAFSSIIGISGMRHNGWYGFSNEILHRFLRQYAQEESATAILSIAYSIWDEVGMGVRMGSTSWLAKMGIEALSAQQGTSHFLRLATHDPGTDQVIVTARTAGLDTFFPQSPALPEGLRFIDKLMVYQPGVEIATRTRLTLEDDPYIRDHCWRGTYLFPLVFGLEAMAQAVRVITGKVCFDTVCIEDIELARPVIISEEKGEEIEIHALVLESDHLRPGLAVQVQIRTAQTDFSREHFSATFIFRDDSPAAELEVPEQLVPLDLDPKLDLYKEDLLFQGPLYQRIQNVFQLTSSTCVFSAATSDSVNDSANDSANDSVEMGEQDWILGNPFLRDALLQSGQLPLPQDLCLPARIQRIERFSTSVRHQGIVLGKALIEEHTDKYIAGTVTFFNEQGQVFERMSGYRAQIIDQREGNPTAEDFVSPGQRDHSIMQEKLKQRDALLPSQCMLPRLSSNFIPRLQKLGRDERRKKELPFIRETLAPLLHASDGRIEISWSQEGKPSLAIPTDAGVHFSLSHNQGTIICTAGRGPQGCDLETVSTREKEEWLVLLGEGSKSLLASLTKQGDSLSRAGTRLWSTLEALFKALALHPDAGMLRISESQEDAVLFLYEDFCVLTFPVQLTLRGERMLAFVIPEKCRNIAISDQVPVSGNTDAWPNKVGSFTHEFTTTFLEGRGPSGKVYFTNIPVWMGELRELALLPIAEHLVRDMKSGQWGMVTNRSFFAVDQLLDSYEDVIGEVRLLEDTDLEKSFLSLAFKWFKKQEDGSLVQAVSGRLATTWVKVQGHGNVQAATLPEYFTSYLEKLSLSPDDSEPPGKNRHPFFAQATPLFSASVSTRKQYMLQQQQFLTSREDSNLVGNIYFSNYYAWQARVRDRYLVTQLPQIASQYLDKDFVCVHAEVHHLQEAMPFETIEVSMYLYKLFEEGFVFYFEYYTIDEQGERGRKLAHGQHGVVWASCVHRKHGEIHPEKMPDEYLWHVMEQIKDAE